MRIDSHQHFWNYDPLRYSWIDASMQKIQRNFLPKDLEPLLKENGFDGSVLVQADQSEEETDFLLKLAAENPWIKGVVGWVDLTAADVGERLKLYAKNPMFKGVRHTHYDSEGEFMGAPEFQRGIGALCALGLTYDILAFDYQLPGAIGLVEKFPEQAFVLDHLGKPEIKTSPDEEWIRNIQRLAGYPNVHCKLSGLSSRVGNPNWKASDFHPFLDVVTEAFGPKRLMFGSDWPVSLTASTFQEGIAIVDSYLADRGIQNPEEIFGGNAARFYNL